LFVEYLIRFFFVFTGSFLENSGKSKFLFIFMIYFYQNIIRPALGDVALERIMSESSSSSISLLYTRILKVRDWVGF